MMAAIDDSNGRVVANQEIGNGNNFERRDNHQGNHHIRGRGKYRGHGRWNMRTDISSCIQVCNDVSENIGTGVQSCCPTKEGTVNGTKVIMMRDTGATCVVVRKSLVREDQVMEEQKCCKFIDGSEHYFSVARIDVKTPYYEGSTEAYCIEGPLYDLVIGNITGAKYPEPEDEVIERNTRVQKILDIPEAELMQLQLEDET